MNKKIIALRSELNVDKMCVPISVLYLLTGTCDGIKDHLKELTKIQNEIRAWNNSDSYFNPAFLRQYGKKEKTSSIYKLPEPKPEYFVKVLFEAIHELREQGIINKDNYKIIIAMADKHKVARHFICLKKENEHYYLHESSKVDVTPTLSKKTSYKGANCMQIDLGKKKEALEGLKTLYSLYCENKTKFAILQLIVLVPYH